MIYTFYSYKGGVGRSMALANIAELFYKQGEDVLIVDFDLEAPGLEDYFINEDSNESISDTIKKSRGIIDLLLSYKELRSLSIPSNFSSKETKEEAEFVFPYPVEPLSNFIIPIYEKIGDKGSISIIPAGRRDGENFAKYAKHVRTFNWDDFYKNWNGELFFKWFQIELSKFATHVLIDSRTGVTEMGGVCVYQLADKVISFVTSNKQNIDGTLRIAKSLSNPEFIEKGRNGRKLSLVFVPSRVEMTSEGKLLDEFSTQFDDTFTAFFDESVSNAYSVENEQCLRVNLNT